MYTTENIDHNHNCQEFLDLINSKTWDIFKTQIEGEI